MTIIESFAVASGTFFGVSIISIILYAGLSFLKINRWIPPAVFLASQIILIQLTVFARDQGFNPQFKNRYNYDIQVLTIGTIILFAFGILFVLLRNPSKTYKFKVFQDINIPNNGKSAARPVTSSIPISNMNVNPKVPTPSAEATPNVMIDKNEDFEIAAKYFPRINDCLRSLLPYGETATKLFKEKIIETKTFDYPEPLVNQIINQELINRFGENQKIQELGKSFIEMGLSRKAEKLSETVRVLGDKIENPEILQSVIESKEIDPEDIAALYTDHIDVWDEKTKTRDVYLFYLARLKNGSVIGKGRDANNNKYQSYKSFADYADKTGIQVAQFWEVTYNKEKEILEFLDILRSQ